MESRVTSNLTLPDIQFTEILLCAAARISARLRGRQRKCIEESGRKQGSRRVLVQPPGPSTTPQLLRKGGSEGRAARDADTRVVQGLRDKQATVPAISAVVPLLYIAEDVLPIQSFGGMLMATGGGVAKARRTLP